MPTTGHKFLAGAMMLSRTAELERVLSTFADKDGMVDTDAVRAVLKAGLDSAGVGSKGVVYDRGREAVVGAEARYGEFHWGRFRGDAEVRRIKIRSGLTPHGPKWYNIVRTGRRARSARKDVIPMLGKIVPVFPDTLAPGYQSGGGSSPSGTSVSWNDITGKPSTFPPSVHSHQQSDVQGLVSAMSGKASKPSSVQPLPDDASLDSVIERLNALTTALKS